MKVSTFIWKIATIVVFIVSAHNGRAQEEVTYKATLQSKQDSIQKYLFTDSEKAERFVQDYLAYAKQTKDSFYIAKGLNFTGMLNYVKSDALKAIEHYLESLRIFEKLEEEWFCAVVLNNIGASYLLRRKPLETISYYEKALARFEVLKDTLWIANMLNNLSTQWVELKDFEKGLSTQKEALAIYEALQDEESIILLKGNMADTYIELNILDTARTLANLYLSHPLAGKSLIQMVNVLSNLSRIEYLEGYFSSALSLINRAIAIAEEQGYGQQHINCLARKATILEKMGNYKEALSVFKSYHEKNDAVFNQEKDDRITELLTQYEVSQKESAIALLEKEKTVARRNLWLLAIGLFTIMIIALLLAALYRSRQKNIQRLQDKNQTISKMLEEKDFLVKEIHHRVKNNLQIISSLLQLQSRYLDEPNAIEALNDGENRVKSMAIIHHYLYSGEQLSKVDVQKYMGNLLNNLHASYNHKAKEIDVRLSVEPLYLDVSIMIPLGLIINELITNIYKYAFTNRDSGNRIDISISTMGTDLHVKVQDNGVGKDTTSSKSGFGTRMIEAFIKKLSATLTTQVSDGTAIDIIIPELEDLKHDKMSA